MSYNAERRYFASFRQNVTPEALEEYRRAVTVLVERYNTVIYENRFVVGGAVEIFTTMLLRSAGVPAVGYGDETASGDIILPRRRMLSVKSTFAKKWREVRLVNTMGEGTTGWSTATLFVIAGVGIVYGDPDMAQAEDLHRAKDALMLRRAAVERFAEDERNVVAINLPYKAPAEMSHLSLKASTVLARQIMSEQGLENLLNQFSD